MCGSRSTRSGDGQVAWPRPRSTSNMPPAVQILTYLNPLRYFMQILRGIFLKGIGLDVLWPQMLALALFGAAIIVLSALRFHKRLD